MFKFFGDLLSKLGEAWKRRDKRKKDARTVAKKTRLELEQLEWGRRIDLGRSNRKPKRRGD